MKNLRWIPKRRFFASGSFQPFNNSRSLSAYWLAPVDLVSHAVVVFESEEAARKAAEDMGVKPGGSLSPGTAFQSVDFVEGAGQA